MLVNNDKYKIVVVVVEMSLTSETGYGKVYTSFDTFRNEHRYSNYRFGFAVVDAETGEKPEGFNDWNDSVEEAMWEIEDRENNLL